MIDSKAPRPLDVQMQPPRAKSSHPSGLEALLDEQQAVELARQASNGDLAAAQTLLEGLRTPVVRVVAGVLGSGHADLEDVTQQTLIALVRALPTFRGECHPAGFACRIALRIASRARRRGRMEQSLRDEFARLGDAPDTVDSPVEVAASERRRQVLRDLLGDLPEEQAESLALRVMLGWSLEEVARATGAPINTVRSRVRLAKEALRRRLEAAPELAEEVSVAR